MSSSTLSTPSIIPSSTTSLSSTLFLASIPLFATINPKSASNISRKIINIDKSSSFNSSVMLYAITEDNFNLYLE